MNLKELKIGKTGIITKVGGSGALRQHFLDMGVIPGAKVTLIKYAPMGDPMELLIHSYTLTIRLADAAKIDITEWFDMSEKVTSLLPKYQVFEEFEASSFDLFKFGIPEDENCVNVTF